MSPTRIQLISLVTWFCSVALPVTFARAQGQERCAACYKVIYTEYLIAEGRAFHYQCFKCAGCGKLIRGTYVAGEEGTFYHESCYQSKMLPPCDVCMKRITGKYYTDYWGTKYCASHKGSVPECSFCGRLIAGPVVGNGLSFADGRILCGICRTSSISNVTVVQTLMEGVAKELANNGIDVDCRRITILLLTQDQFDKLSEGHDQYHGFTDFSEAANTSAANLLLLTGMPEIEMRSVLAHELMHVWMFRHGMLQAGTQVAEGTCNYASLMVMKAANTPESMYVIRTMMEDTNAVYGTGFRDVKRFVDTRGVNAWLEMLCQTAKSD